MKSFIGEDLLDKVTKNQEGKDIIAVFKYLSNVCVPAQQIKIKQVELKFPIPIGKGWRD